MPINRQFHSHQMRDFQLKMHLNPFGGQASAAPAAGELTELLQTP